MVHRVFEIKHGSNGAVREAIIRIGGEPLNNPDAQIYNGVTYYHLNRVGGSILYDGHSRITVGADSKDMLTDILLNFEKVSGIKMRDLR